MDKIRGIPLMQQSTAVDRTMKEIESLKEGKIACLKTRWNKLNKIMLGGFRFKQNVVIAGISGHGKSWFLQLLENDLLSQTLNPDFPDPVLIIHFGFEMPVEDEITRMITSATSIPYSDIISAFTKLESYRWDQIKAKADELKSYKIFRAVRSGNRYEIIETIKIMQDKFPDHKIIFTIDHSLLVQAFDEKTEVELIAALSKTLIQLKQDYGTMGIVLGQMLQDITTPMRVQNRAAHYPILNDIHGSKQIIHAVDWMFSINDPSRYFPRSIPVYGDLMLHYQDKLFLHTLKGRFAEETGIIELGKDFKHGNLIDLSDQPPQPPPQHSYGLTLD